MWHLACRWDILFMPQDFCSTVAHSWQIWWKNIPMVYFLLPGFSEDIYVHALEVLKQKIDELPEEETSSPQKKNKILLPVVPVKEIKMMENLPLLTNITSISLWILSSHRLMPSLRFPTVPPPMGAIFILDKPLKSISRKIHAWIVLLKVILVWKPSKPSILLLPLLSSKSLIKLSYTMTL